MINTQIYLIRNNYKQHQTNILQVSRVSLSLFLRMVSHYQIDKLPSPWLSVKLLRYNVVTVKLR